MSDKPPLWVVAQIGWLCKLVNGRAFKPSDWSNEGLPIIRIQNLNNASASFNYYKGNFDKRFAVKNGDLLFAWSGTPGTSFGAHIWQGGDAILNQHIFNISFDESSIDKEFFRLAINQKLQQLIDIAHGGVGLRHVTKGMFERTEIALPPVTEQRRIVAKLNGLTARSSRVQEELDHIPILIGNYKQAILEKAFTGTLTAEWRSKQPLEPTSPQDLERNRRAGWENLNREGKIRGTYKSALSIDWQPDITLPDQWVWASVDQLISRAQYGTSAKTNDDPSGVPVLRMGNIQNGRLDLTKLRWLPDDHEEFPELLLEPGDILFNRTNSAELVGKTAVYNAAGTETSFASYLIRLTAVGIEPDLLALYINSRFGRRWIASVVNQQVGQANVNGTKLRGLGVPVMPQDEQRHLLLLLRQAFEQLDIIATEHRHMDHLLPKLDEAILARAFRGALVLQDPADEPAKALLARLCGETAQHPLLS